MYSRVHCTVGFLRTYTLMLVYTEKHDLPTYPEPPKKPIYLVRGRYIAVTHSPIRPYLPIPTAKRASINDMHMVTCMYYGYRAGVYAARVEQAHITWLCRTRTPACTPAVRRSKLSRMHAFFSAGRAMAVAALLSGFVKEKAMMPHAS